ncbi:hypothetical protein TWF281_010430 [Arthrobotrys megalospora]
MLPQLYQLHRLNSRDDGSYDPYTHTDADHHQDESYKAKILLIITASVFSAIFLAFVASCIKERCWRRRMRNRVKAVWDGIELERQNNFNNVVDSGETASGADALNVGYHYQADLNSPPTFPTDIYQSDIYRPPGYEAETRCQPGDIPEKVYQSI